MKNWQLIARGSLKLNQTDGREPVGKEIRVKIDKVLLSATDTIVYDEKILPPYPLTPGEYAIGRVSSGFGVDMRAEEKAGRYTFCRNEKVILRSFFAGRDGLPVTAGVHVNGYLKDYAYVEPDCLFHIPPKITDDEALYLGMVSIAENAVDKLKAEEGDFILVSGDDILSVIICRLLLYYKSVPILATSTDDKVSRAKRAGIFYSYRVNDELKENVFQITSGRLCDGAIYTNPINKTAPSVIMNLVRPQTNIVLAGISDRSWSLDSALITKKALNVCGVYTGLGFEKIALNVLAGEFINLNEFTKDLMYFVDAPKAYSSLTSKNATGYGVSIINIP